MPETVFQVIDRTPDFAKLNPGYLSRRFRGESFGHLDMYVKEVARESN
jgi:hypothetical protein